MNCRPALLLALSLTANAASPLSPAPDWLHIEKNEVDGVTSMSAVRLADVDEISFAPADNATNTFHEMVIKKRSGVENIVNMDDVKRYSLSTNVPTIYIHTADTTVTDVTDKVNYLPGTLSIEAYGEQQSMSLQPIGVKVRGRGNSTMLYEKKPYRLNFGDNADKATKKPSLLGMKKAKNYALIANVQDPTLMYNSVAFHMARSLGMNYVNSSVPVNVIFNGIPKGSYMLTEKIGINSASVDIDELQGRLLEISSDYDEDFKFKSLIYKLPVMVKDPDLSEIASSQGTTAEELLYEIQRDILAMEISVMTGTPEKAFDMDALASYMIVNLVAGNKELIQPKSLYLYKDKLSSKYTLGPVWDFDWAFSYCFPPDSPMLVNEGSSGYATKAGYKLIKQIVQSKAFEAAFNTKWQEFMTNIYPNLFSWIDTYASTVRPSALQNGDIWRGRISSTPFGWPKDSGTFDAEVDKLKDWLKQRVNFINRAPHHGFY